MKIANMLPFLDEEGLQQIVDGIVDGTITDLSVTSLLPFASEQQVGQLYKFALAHPEKHISTSAFLPFLDDVFVDDEFLKELHEGRIAKTLIPFVSDNALHQAVEFYIQNPNTNIDLDCLYPFLDDKDITLLMKTYLSHKRAKATADTTVDNADANATDNTTNNTSDSKHD